MCKMRNEQFQVMCDHVVMIMMINDDFSEKM